MDVSQNQQCDTQQSMYDIQRFKQEICDLCCNMEKNDLVDILTFLKQQHLHDSLFSQNCDGIKINLDMIPANTIRNLHAYVLYKVAPCPKNDDAGQPFANTIMNDQLSEC